MKQKAIVNCKRCYELLKKTNQTEASVCESDKIYSVRNEAMSALEEAINVMDSHNDPEAIDKDRAYTVARSFLDKALDECMDCDYEQPSMAKHLLDE